MAGDLNRTVLVGRLTRDPDLRQIASGNNLCRFSIANNRIFSQDGEKREEVSFFNCTAWGRLAETIQKYCHRGKQVALEGRLRQNSWQDNEGKKHSSVELVVEQCQFLGSLQDRSSPAVSHAAPQEKSYGPPVGAADSAQRAGSLQAIPMGNPQSEAAQNTSYSEQGPVEDDDIPF